MLVYQRVHSSFMKCWLQKSELAMGFWEKHRTTKRWDFWIFQRLCGLSPYEMTRFPPTRLGETWFPSSGGLINGRFMTPFSPNMSPWKTPKTIQDHFWSIWKKYIPYSSTSGKKNSKPLWCHQTWKIPELNRRIIELVFHVSHDLKVYVPRYRKLYPLVMTNSLLAGTWP